MSANRLITSEEAASLDGIANTAEDNLRAHIIQSFGAAHQVIPAQTSVMASSAGIALGDTVLSVVVGGTTYYVPARYVAVSST